jgi:hypothetical protein
MLAAVGFPIIILLLVPLRTLVVSRLPFSTEELGILDRPTASPFVSRRKPARTSFDVGSCSRLCSQLVDSRESCRGVLAPAQAGMLSKPGWWFSSHVVIMLSLTPPFDALESTANSEKPGATLFPISCDILRRRLS